MIAAVPRRRGRPLPLLVTVVAFAAVVVASVVSTRIGSGGGATDALDRATVAAFAAQMERLGADGGQIVADGMKPGVADVAQRSLPDEVLARMARGWVDSMREVASEVSALDAPGPLAAVAARFDRAVLTYVRAAEALFDAATADGQQRADLIDRAIALGGDADRLYDEAREALADLQRSTVDGSR